MNEIIATVERLRDIRARVDAEQVLIREAGWDDRRAVLHALLLKDRRWLLAYIRRLQAEIQRLEDTSHG